MPEETKDGAAAAAMEERDRLFMDIAQLRFSLHQMTLPNAAEMKAKLLGHIKDRGTCSARNAGRCSGLCPACDDLSMCLADTPSVCAAMAPFYRATCQLLGWELDAALVGQMEAANTAELAQA